MQIAYKSVILYLYIIIGLTLTGCTQDYKFSPEGGQILINISAAVPGLWKLVTAAAYLMGVFFAAAAVFHLRVYGELRTMMSTQTNLKRPLMLLLVSAVFMYLPESFAVIMQSSFGYSGARNALSYAGDNGPGLDYAGTVALIRVVQFIGLISFVRGWMFLVKSTQPGAQVGAGKAMTHIIGGVMCINIVGVTDILGKSFAG